MTREREADPAPRPLSPSPMDQTGGGLTDKSRASIARSVQDQLGAGEEIRAVFPFTQTSRRPRLPGEKRRDRVVTGVYQSAAPLPPALSSRIDGSSYLIDLPRLGVVPFEAGRKERNEALRIRELLSAP